MSEEEIEKILRSAPQPGAPNQLKERLIKEVSLPSVPRSSARSWLRRWWPILAPATVSAACAAILTGQQSEMNDLRKTNQVLSQGAAGDQASALQPDVDQPSPQPMETANPEQAEIERLRQVVARLRSEVAQLERVRAENQKLRAELSRPLPGNSAAENTASDQEREKAQLIRCINNMKQLGLAARVWALDNTNLYPEQVAFMTNEMGSPQILVCPSDTARQPATGWASWSPDNCSYEYLAPGAESDKEPQRVLFRCPIHGNVTLCDGSVQSQLAKDHPERLVERDGKLYEIDASPSNPTPGPSNQ